MTLFFKRTNDTYFVLDVQQNLDKTAVEIAQNMGVGGISRMEVLKKSATRSLRLHASGALSQSGTRCFSDGNLGGAWRRKIPTASCQAFVNARKWLEENKIENCK